MTDIIDQITRFADEHNGQPWAWVHFTREPGIVSTEKRSSPSRGQVYVGGRRNGKSHRVKPALPQPCNTPPMWANDVARSRRPRKNRNQPTRQGIQ